MPAHLWPYPEAQPDLRHKLGKDLRKKLEQKNTTSASPADVINWAEHVEEVQPSSSISEFPAVFVSADKRDEESAFKNRSKLTVKIKSYGQHEGKR